MIAPPVGKYEGIAPRFTRAVPLTSKLYVGFEVLIPTFPLLSSARLLSGLRLDQLADVPIKLNAVEFTESVKAVALVAMFIRRLVDGPAVRGLAGGKKLVVYNAVPLRMRRFPM